MIGPTLGKSDNADIITTSQKFLNARPARIIDLDTVTATLLSQGSAGTLCSQDEGMHPGSATILAIQLGMRRQSLLRDCRETYKM